MKALNRMKETKRRYGIILIVLIIVFLAVFPRIEIQGDEIFIACRYTDSISEFEDELSYNEKYWYYEERDISFYSLDIKKFLCFHIIIMQYEEGNYCDTQFMLDESYINAFIEFATIDYNSSDINVEELIEGKVPIMGNTRYIRPENAAQIDYDLEGDYATMFVYEVDDLLVFEVRFPDEGSHYIAYR